MSRKILLIDDSRTMRQVLKVYLMGGGTYDFIEADSGSRGLDLLRVVPVDLVIADVNMPKMDGFEFVKQVRAAALPRMQVVPIVLVTSDKSEDVRAKIKTARIDAFLPKPIRAEELVSVVQRLLNEKGQ